MKLLKLFKKCYQTEKKMIFCGPLRTPNITFQDSDLKINHLTKSLANYSEEDPEHK